MLLLFISFYCCAVYVSFLFTIVLLSFFRNRYTLLPFMFTSLLVVHATLAVNATLAVHAALATATTLRNSSHATMLFC